MGRLLTVGHGTLDRSGLSALFKDAHVALVVDVRRFPGSRHNPDVSTEAMAQWLPDAGFHYRWEQRLGGRRRLTSEDDPDADRWWRVEAFRAYAAHTRTPEFLTALDDLAVDVAAHRTTAIMCSESVWWRCHRRLVADAAALLRGIDVAHLAHDGRTTPHEPSAGVRVADGLLRYDAAAEE
jgi:uncharacterized protein (DUF488 family)